MTAAAQNQPRPGFAGGIPLLVLILGLGFTALATVWVHQSTAKRDEARFAQAVEEAKNDIIARMEAYMGHLRAGAGLFAASDEVTRDEWRSFVGRLQLQEYSPGIQGIGFSRRILPGEEATVLAELRNNYGPDAKLWHAMLPLSPPAAAAGAAPPTTTQASRPLPQHRQNPPSQVGTPDRYAIVYLEPMNPSNRIAIGFDMYSDNIRRAAMASAAEEGVAVASGKVRLVQEGFPPAQIAPAQAGFLIYVPVYRGGSIPPKGPQRRQELLGFVYSPYRMNDLIHGIFGERINTAVSFDIYDGERAPEHLLYRSSVDPGHEPRYRAPAKIDVARRTWTIDFASLPRLERQMGMNLTPFVLVTGLVFSAALFGLTRSQVSARRAAEQIALDLHASQHALRVSEARFRRLAESNVIGVVFCDTSGRISRGNLEFFRLIGHDREEVLSGRVRMDTITPTEYRAADAVALAQLRSHSVAEPYEKEFVRPDGSRVPVLFGMAMLEGSTSECVGFCVDLSELKETARELKRAKELAENANRAKDQFLAVLSHELRTPLTPVLALATAAQRDPNLPARLREDFAMIHRNIDLEARLIDDLLDLTKIGRGKIRLALETIDIHHAIRHAADVVASGEVDAKDLDLRVDLRATSHHVRGDAARLRQVFWNLLKNAVKFTPAGGRITVTSENDAAGRILIRVTDTGIGIAPQLLPRIFDAFEQGDPAIDASAPSSGGLGLGLAISKGLVVAHGGTIVATSAGSNRGATFTVALDTVPVEAPVPTPQPAPAVEQPSQRSILLVEDHLDTARALSRLLVSCGYEVTTAHSVKSALEMAEQVRFDVLVSDLGLPDGSGLELMRRIRERRRDGEPTPGIALTGFGMEEDLAKTKQAGFSEHLTKPVNFENLQRAIERVTVPSAPRTAAGATPTPASTSAAGSPPT